ncbi:SDR family NAD(P)-dependent oxidoreductase [Quadrisphaera sp. DSM 44207]|uniref:SDR family NAD(P)-dependent oxidoreductase n=1 Tax=Quadrisphaera sp. DSM 44207 TaxID=1881057 RepID=UPI0008903C63|nr:SDR family oxidoreductase [Quadrisphaera sp. DSM 44207]SDQ51944.1 Short-chain dehydrogenase [Quadrisphaera sp. DSM 44207]
MSAPPPARTALVTGASSGLGRIIAAGLARAGLAVAVHGRDAERLAATAADVEGAGARCAVVTADVTDVEQVRAAVDRAEAALGPIDLLVSSAGVIEAEEVPLWEADPQQWRTVVEADLLGPFHCARAVVPGMLERGGGRVVDLNSGAGVKDNALYSAYGAAKAGLFRVGGALHAAGYERGLRAFELAPGVVRTPMTAAMPVHEGRTEWTEPEDVVALVVAMARGQLDPWSGRMLRAGVDTAPALRERAAAGLPERARTLGLLPYGPDDPLA